MILRLLSSKDSMQNLRFHSVTLPTHLAYTRAKAPVSLSNALWRVSNGKRRKGCYGLLTVMVSQVSEAYQFSTTTCYTSETARL
jgi:hypothetical protein